MYFRPHRTHSAECGLLLQSTDRVAWSAYLCVCSCVLGTPVSLAKTEEPIQMSFGAKLVLDQGTHVLDRNARWRHLANMIDRSVRSNDAACRHHCLSIVHVLPAGLLRCWMGDRRAFTDVNFPKVLFQNRQKKETEDNR